MASETWNTPGTYTWTVPSGVSTITVEANGAAGEDSGGGSGGHGGRIVTEYSVSSSDTINILVEGVGDGGAGGASTKNSGSAPAGGGLAKVEHGDGTIIAVGGGGGAAGEYIESNENATNGGAGGPLEGEDAVKPQNDIYQGTPGDGGTQSAGGAGGGRGSNGAFLSGGSGGNGKTDSRQGYTAYGGAGGGGGKGYYGGGGGDAGDCSVEYYTYGYNAENGNGAGAGGGSNYAAGTIQTNERGANSGDGSVTISYTQPPATPNNTSASYVADDQIDLSFDDETNNSASSYDVQIQRDGGSWVIPSGGPSSINDDGSASFSASYGPNSDNSYGSQVGIDSSFRFRVRATNSAGSSSWAYSGTVYTTPIPPHNPSVSRPDANTVEVTYTVQSDQTTKSVIFYRKDTGGGYGGWSWVGKVDNHGRDATGQTRTQTLSTTNESWMDEDSRYQFKIRSENADASARLDSEFVYCDYGNSGNVYFEDGFESGDLSAWDNSSTASIESSPTDGVSGGVEQGTYYARPSNGISIEKTIDLSDSPEDSDVIARFAFSGYHAETGEGLRVGVNDGSDWSYLETYNWEYNRQGWSEAHVVIPKSFHSSNTIVRLHAYGGVAYGIDRVVVSDVLHEYTSPTAPSGLSSNNSTAGELTFSWNSNASFKYTSTLDYKPSSDSTWIDEGWSPTTPHTITGLNDGEEYDWRVMDFIRQDRHGSTENWVNTGYVTGSPITTRSPAPTNLSVSNITKDSADLNWTDNHNNEDAYRVWTERADNPTGMNFPNQADYIEIPEIELGSEFTVVVSHKNNGLKDWLEPFGKEGYVSMLKYADGSSFASVGNGTWNENIILDAGTYQDNTKYHDTMRVSGGELKFFINGVESGSVSTSTSIPSTQYAIGKRLDQDDGYGWEGDIYETRIYNRGLSASEINGLYNGVHITDDLVGYWPLDHNDGGVTHDVSEFSNDGTVNGATVTGAGITDKSGTLSPGTQNYTLSGLLDGEQYNTFVESETEHSVTRDQ